MRYSYQHKLITCLTNSNRQIISDCDVKKLRIHLSTLSISILLNKFQFSALIKHIYMVYIAVLLTVFLGYLAYILFIKPLRLKSYYSKIFKAHGYKAYEHPYRVLGIPCFDDLLRSQKQKKDFRYTGIHVLSDSYDVIISNVFNKPQVVFLNQKMIKAFFDKDLQMAAPKMDFAFKITIFTAKRGLVFLQKNVWKNRRVILSKIFNFDFIYSQIPNMILTANNLFQKFQEQHWIANPENKEKRLIKLSLFDLISKYTSSIVIVGFLGLELLDEKLRGKSIQEQIMRLTDDSVNLSRELPNMIFGEKFLKLGLRKVDRQFFAFNQEIDNILLAFINKCRQKSKDKHNTEKKEPKTIVGLIFEEMEKEKNTQKKETEITDLDLVDQIKTFANAGTETTSNYLTMLILYIYEHKEVLQKLRTQIAKHIKSDQDITYQNIKKITYLDCVMAQGSRMMPAVQGGFQRILQEDAVICDIPLKKGTCLNIYNRPLLSNPNIFKEPLCFKPDRWQAQTQQNKRLLQLISFQFYGGPRGCIGKQLALLQTKIGVIKFLDRYKNLVQPGMKNRVIQHKVTAHLVDSEVILQKY